MSKKHILFTISGVLAVLTIVSTISSISYGSQISSLNKKEQVLFNEQKELEENLVIKSSSKDLASKSVEFGFEKSSNIFYLTKTDAVAKLP